MHGLTNLKIKTEVLLGVLYEVESTSFHLSVCLSVT